MATDRWEQAKRLLEALLLLRGEQREAVLGALDPSLREEVESLLPSHQEADSFLEKPPLEEMPAQPKVHDEDSVTQVRPECSPERSPQSHAHGDYIGEYRILREIGHGGMGVVYEAEQQHPRRSVALKVIRGERDVDEYHVRLFQREAQALARLKHPGIAGIYEGGRTDDGQHFFAMELVTGEPLSEYLSKRPKEIPWKAELKFRLELFVKICEAVNYAHQKGVIHRDLKPSNILVSKEAESGSGSTRTRGPQIKILDFGLARITDPEAGDITSMTAMGRIQGTLPYMSPEQAKGIPEYIDVRTDVYSLGVILYEMITGKKPHDIQPSAPLEALRLICQEPPKNPRQVLKEAGRQSDSDLETILLKALEKDSAERYQSVAAFSEDIRNYLSDRPILAHPPSMIYQLRKVVSRHKVGFGFVATVFVLLAVLAVTMSVQSGRIARERDRAEQEAAKAKAINEFLQETLGTADPYEGAGREVTVTEALDAAVGKIDESFGEQPEIEAAVRNTIGNTYYTLARYELAEPLLKQALEIRMTTLGNEHLDVAESLHHLGLLHLDRRDHARKDYEAAEKCFREALAIRRRQMGDEHLDVADGVNALGVLRYYQADYGRAEALFREALGIRRRLLGEDNLVVAQSLGNLAAVLNDKGDPEAAEPLYYEAIEIERRFSGGASPQFATSLHNLAFFLDDKGDHESAVRYQREALEIDREVFGDENVGVAIGLTDLAFMLNRKGEYNAAEPLAREALALHRKLTNEKHSRIAYCLETLANALVGLGRYPEAERFYLEALEMYEELVNADHWGLAAGRSNYGHLLTKVGRYQEAEEKLLLAFQVLRSVFGEQHHRTQRSLRRLVELYESWGKPEKAAEYCALLTNEESE